MIKLKKPMIYLKIYMERSSSMRIWINKNKILEEQDEKFYNAYEFSIKRNE